MGNKSAQLVQVWKNKLGLGKTKRSLVTVEKKLKYRTNAEDTFGVNFQLYCIRCCSPVSED